MLGLTFIDGVETLASQDQVILSVPPWIAQKLFCGISGPDAFHAIVNAHFRLLPPPRERAAMVGLIGGTAEWVFAFHDRLSVTGQCRGPSGSTDRLTPWPSCCGATLHWSTG